MRRSIIRAALAAAFAVPSLLPAQPRDYPARPVRLIVGFAPGSTTDLVGRIVADGLRARFGQPFIVENRPGANGMLAAEAVARAEPDGYTLLVANTSSVTVNPLIYKNIRYNVAKDFAPVTTVVSLPMILMVNTQNPRTAGVRTVKDLAALAKTQPGGLTYGSGGNGNLLHLAGAQLSQLLGMTTIHVPYKGASLMETALLAKEIDFAFDTLSAMPHVRAGTLRPLLVTVTERWPDLPEVPNVVEADLKGMNMPIWTGVLAPAGTPAQIVDSLNQAIAALEQDAGAREKLQRQGRISTKSPDAFARQIAEELKENAALVKQADIGVE
jgi:tripartite-type tricarboxylate transporter receptor subunit TctC